MDVESVMKRNDVADLGSNPRFLAVIEQARTRCRQGLGLSSEAVRRELGLP